ncbi:MAG TPA: ammonium transporter [Hyphomicrobiaceae bacterium]|nr:ammonium transporter [Hyphomicrobiaceae bacterium]
MAGLALDPAAAQEAAKPTLDKGDTAWMLTSTVLVLLMIVPGLALFYGGLVRTKNMLSLLTQVLAVTCVVTIIWALYGYSYAFTEGSPFIGGGSKAFLRGIAPDTLSDIAKTIPEYVFVFFQMTFAAITTALVLGGVVERVKFFAILLFAILWITFVYIPIAHMVWGGDGLLASMGAKDFAGGTVVHINSGIAALVGALIVGKRVGHGKEAMPPHSLTLTLVGGALLWVGWFGFNAGSAVAADGVAALAMANTFVATAAAGLSWMVLEWLAKGKPSLLGLISGVIAGLVAVTPAAGFVGPMGAIILGLIAGAVCLFFCTTVKAALGYDESLDVFGIHCVGGIVGSVLTGVFISPSLGGVGGIEGYTMAGQVMTQITAVAVALVWSAVGTFIIFMVLKVIGIRPAVDAEREGLDLTDHGERAYNY